MCIGVVFPLCASEMNTLYDRTDVLCTVCSGQFLVLLRRLDSSSSLQLATASVTRQRIRNIMNAAGYVSDLATPYIRLRQPEYFNGISTRNPKVIWESRVATPHGRE